MWSNYNSHVLLVGMEIGTTTLENCQYPLNLKMYDRDVPLLGIYSREIKAKVMCSIDMFYSNIIYNIKN